LTTIHALPLDSLVAECSLSLKIEATPAASSPHSPIVPRKRPVITCSSSMTPPVAYPLVMVCVLLIINRPAWTSDSSSSSLQFDSGSFFSDPSPAIHFLLRVPL